jgi:uncharacterized protein YbjT (DUF2867 family)
VVKLTIMAAGGRGLVADKAWRVFSAVEEGKDQLRVFRADMAGEGSFDAAATGCVAFFHVAASMDIHVPPQNGNDNNIGNLRSLISAKSRLLPSIATNRMHIWIRP